MCRFSLSSQNGKGTYISFQDLETCLVSTRMLFQRRLNTLHSFILEDFSFQDFFSVEEWEIFDSLYNTLFFTSTDETPLPAWRQMKFQFSKETGPSEVMTIEVGDFDTENEILEAVEKTFTLLNSFIIEQQEALFDFTKQMSSLSTDLQLRLKMLFDVLYGRTDGNMILERLKGDRDNRSENQQTQPISPFNGENFNGNSSLLMGA